MKHKYLFLLLGAMIIASACSDNRKGAKRIAFIKAVSAEFDGKLPISYGDAFRMTSYETSTDCITLHIEVSEDYTDLIGPSSIVDDDRRILASAKSGSYNLPDILVEFEVDMRAIFTAESDGRPLGEILVEWRRVKEVKEKEARGELQAYTLLEKIQAELDAVDYPIDMGDGIVWQSYHMEGSTVVYDYYVDDDELFSYILADEETVEEMKVDMLEDFDMIKLCYKEDDMRANDVRFCYAFADRRGKEIGRIYFTLDDIYGK